MSSNSSIQAFKKYKDLVDAHILDFIAEIEPMSKEL